MTASIIIAVKTWQENLEECVGKCLELDYPDYEILVLPDSGQEGLIRNAKLKFIPTGPVSPARKRDLALSHAKGEILAFIDDDAFPAKGWLKDALRHFENEEVACVGGPAVTAPNDSLRQKASGRIYSSFLVGANLKYRYVPRKQREVDDFPSCNFLVRKSVMQELGGFATDFWPGEDTKLCLDITKKLKKKIIYDPAVLVYHHRRPVFLPHLKQVANYAFHRGFFAKKYPQTSLRIFYFIPSLYLCFLIGAGALSLFFETPRSIYFFCLALYLTLVWLFSLSGNFRLTVLVSAGTVLTHINYGVYFLKGLMTRRIKGE